MYKNINKNPKPNTTSKLPPLVKKTPDKVLTPFAPFNFLNGVKILQSRQLSSVLCSSKKNKFTAQATQKQKEKIEKLMKKSFPYDDYNLPFTGLDFDIEYQTAYLPVNVENELFLQPMVMFDIFKFNFTGLYLYGFIPNGERIPIGVNNEYTLNGVEFKILNTENSKAPYKIERNLTMEATVEPPLLDEKTKKLMSTAILECTKDNIMEAAAKFNELYQTQLKTTSKSAPSYKIRDIKTINTKASPAIPTTVSKNVQNPLKTTSKSVPTNGSQNPPQTTSNSASSYKIRPTKIRRPEESPAGPTTVSKNGQNPPQTTSNSAPTKDYKIRDIKTINTEAGNKTVNIYKIDDFKQYRAGSATQPILFSGELKTINKTINNSDKKLEYRNACVLTQKDEQLFLQPVVVFNTNQYKDQATIHNGIIPNGEAIPVKLNEEMQINGATFKIEQNGTNKYKYQVNYVGNMKFSEANLDKEIENFMRDVLDDKTPIKLDDADDRAQDKKMKDAFVKILEKLKSSKQQNTQQDTKQDEMVKTFTRRGRMYKDKTEHGQQNVPQGTLNDVDPFTKEQDLLNIATVIRPVNLRGNRFKKVNNVKPTITNFKCIDVDDLNLNNLSDEQYTMSERHFSSLSTSKVQYVTQYSLFKPGNPDTQDPNAYMLLCDEDSTKYLQPVIMLHGVPIKNGALIPFEKSEAGLEIATVNGYKISAQEDAGEYNLKYPKNFTYPNVEIPDDVVGVMSMVGNLHTENQKLKPEELAGLVNQKLIDNALKEPITFEFTIQNKRMFHSDVFTKDSFDEKLQGSYKEDATQAFTTAAKNFDMQFYHDSGKLTLTSREGIMDIYRGLVSDKSSKVEWRGSKIEIPLDKNKEEFFAISKNAGIRTKYENGELKAEFVMGRSDYITQEHEKTFPKRPQEKLPQVGNNLLLTRTFIYSKT